MVSEQDKAKVITKAKAKAKAKTEDIKSTSRQYVIAHVIYHFGMGGLENGLVNLINRLPEDKYRHVVICMTGHDHFKERLNKPVDIYDMHKKPGKDLMVYIRLWKALRKIKPDIVHTRNLSALEAQLPALLAGVPIRIHGEHGRDVHDLDGNNKRYQQIRKLFSYIVDRYIPLSQDLKTYLTDKVGIKAHKITTICNGVDINKFQVYQKNNTDIADAPEGFFNKGTIVIGTVGRLEQVKDQMNLLDAFILLLKQLEVQDKDIKLLLVGDGSQKTKLEQKIKTQQLQKKVWLAGARDEVPELMNSMSIFVLPSLAEGISNTILEAMACGLPVIATGVGGNSELVNHAQTGWIVPRSDPQAIKEKCLQYIQSSDMLELHSQMARQTIEEKFSINTMVNNYNSVYTTLIKQKMAL